MENGKGGGTVMKLEHILIVEDNIDQANELSAMVSSLLSDAHIFIATCYEDALYLVKQEIFQCFLLVFYFLVILLVVFLIFLKRSRPFYANKYS